MRSLVFLFYRFYNHRQPARRSSYLVVLINERATLPAQPIGLLPEIKYFLTLQLPLEMALADQPLVLLLLTPFATRLIGVQVTHGGVLPGTDFCHGKSVSGRKGRTRREIPRGGCDNVRRHMLS